MTLNKEAEQSSKHNNKPMEFLPKIEVKEKLFSIRMLLIIEYKNQTRTIIKRVVYKKELNC